MCTNIQMFRLLGRIQIVFKCLAYLTGFKSPKSPSTYLCLLLGVYMCSMYVCMYACMYVNPRTTHTPMRACVYVCECARVRVFVCDNYVACWLTCIEKTSDSTAMILINKTQIQAWVWCGHMCMHHALHICRYHLKVSARIWAHKYMKIHIFTCNIRI